MDGNKEISDQTNSDSTSNSENQFLITTYVEVWKKVIEVQQHFNEIAMKIRNVAFSVVGALLAFSGYLYKEDISLTFRSYSIPFSAIVIFLAAILLFCFLFVDLFWYHRLLVGAVTEAKIIETNLKKLKIHIGLTTTIESESRKPLLGWVKFKWVKKLSELKARTKLFIFYMFGIIILTAISCLIIIVNNL